MEHTPTLQGLGKPLRDLHTQHFTDLIEPLRPALWRYCLRLTGSPWDAEDLAQETLLKAFARLTQLWQPLHAKSYLFRIATNTWIDSLRRARLPIDSLEAAGQLADSETSQDPTTTWAAIETLVTVLPPRQRVVVLLTQVFDFTAKEVAAMIGSTEGAVKAALRRARESLTQRGTAAADPTAARLPAPNAVITSYLDAFNRRDPDAIASLLAEEMTSDIVGVGLEYGAETARKNSLTEWAAYSPPMYAEYGRLDGQDTVFVYLGTPAQPGPLTWLVTVEVADGQIVGMRNYCFCPDLIQYAADRLGVPAQLEGYRYHSPSN